MGNNCKKITYGNSYTWSFVSAAGKEAFVWTKKSGRYAFLMGMYQLLFNLLSAINIYNEGPKIIKNDMISLIFIYLMLCLSVGLFEEGLFRGIIMNGFVKAMPKTKAGFIGAIISSSFIFGFVHIMSYIPYITANPLSISVQMIWKIIDAGSIGMLLAAIYLKTKNLWVCVILHALYDFVLFIAASFSKIGSAFPAPQYVDMTQIMSQEALLSYVIMCLWNLPNIIIALWILKKLEPSECIIWK